VLIVWLTAKNGYFQPELDLITSLEHVDHGIIQAVKVLNLSKAQTMHEITMVMAQITRQ
jgi:hypothetical protein